MICPMLFFATCSLKQMKLDQSQFINTEFFKTPLKDLDFTTCILEGISVSTEGNELKGALVNVYQAAELAKLLGNCYQRRPMIYRIKIDSTPGKWYSINMERKGKFISQRLNQ